MARFQEPNRAQQIEWKGDVDSLLPPDHLARFIWNELKTLDFHEIEAQYPAVQGGPGRSPYHPRLVVALWLYGMCEGLETAAAIAEACSLRVDFKWLVGGLQPCDQTLLNFLKRAQETLLSIWVQVLRAMDRAGLIVLDLIVEDGTKLRVDASPRSFRTKEQIGKLLEQLRTRLAARMAEMEVHPERVDRSSQVQLSALRGQIERAESAEADLKCRKTEEPIDLTADTDPQNDHPKPSPVYGSDDFHPHPERDTLLCPGEQELRFIGEYPFDKTSRETYRLYGRSDCNGCVLKDKCTQARGRRVKVRPRVPVESGAPLPLPDPMKQQVTKTNAAAAEAPREPTASLTEPESRWMKATSRKRWEPCFNADICITTDGIIVSQFLTQENTDYHNFSPSLDFVLATLGTPPRWVGDGHYGTAENLQTANSHGVLLYAPRRGLETESDSTSEQSINDTVRSSEPPNSSTRTGTADSRFRNRDFKQGHQEDVLLCPAGETLRFIGEYPNDASRGGTYRLYGRSDCSDCALKERCTTGQGRRVRRLQHLGQRGPPPEATSTREDALTSPRAHDLPAADLPQLIDDLQKRMLTDGKELMRIRGQTIEPTNAQLKLHGLGRFHVHGLARCGIVLTIACLAHNLMKWAARQTTQKLAAI